jgi:hypothetical protein
MMRRSRYGACWIAGREVRLRSLKKLNSQKSILIIIKSYLQITNKYFLLFNNIDKVHVIRSHAREKG